MFGTGNNVSIDNIDNRHLTEKYCQNTNNEEEEMPNISICFLCARFVVQQKIAKKYFQK